MRMVSKLIGAVFVAAVINLSTLSTVGGPVVPTYDEFGELAWATFGGSGIPNDAVAISTITGPTGQSGTLGLTATGRYANPPTGNNGAGVFTATPGGDTPSSYARWNIDFAGAVIPTIAPGAGAEFLYDLDPAVGTDESALGVVRIPLATAFEDSWNLGFGFLASGIPGSVTPPAYGSFDPEANGEYSFVLRVVDETGAEVGRSAILVNVGDVSNPPSSVPDAGSTLALFGIAGISLAAFRRKTRS